MSSTQPTDQRAEYIAGLRALADLLEANPDLEMPYTGSSQGAALHVIPLDAPREQLAAWSRALPGRKEKQDGKTSFVLAGALRGLHVSLLCERAKVCERVVVGTHEVTEEVPDPEALAALPKVTVTRTVEQVEWRCTPLLAGGVITDPLAALTDTTLVAVA